jgi:hypothetical protein
MLGVQFFVDNYIATRGRRVIAVTNMGTVWEALRFYLKT